ncbi:hypothetical protein LJC46_02190 [Desulfovibrio sp. OttesenSCG-928-G15]|nr:hypothetical protein [Desulfovibrio sp. OttesenSCG-928-G15]
MKRRTPPKARRVAPARPRPPKPAPSATAYLEGMARVGITCIVAGLYTYGT